MEYYENYLGEAAKNQQGAAEFSLYFVLLHLASAAIISTLIVLVCKFVWNQLNISEKQAQINFDCD